MDTHDQRHMYTIRKYKHLHIHLYIYDSRTIFILDSVAYHDGRLDENYREIFRQRLFSSRIHPLYVIDIIFSSDRENIDVYRYNYTRWSSIYIYIYIEWDDATYDIHHVQKHYSRGREKTYESLKSAIFFLKFWTIVEKNILALTSRVDTDDKDDDKDDKDKDNDEDDTNVCMCVP
jgi:hypothetical protein